VAITLKLFFVLGAELKAVFVPEQTVYHRGLIKCRRIVSELDTPTWCPRDHSDYISLQLHVEDDPKPRYYTFFLNFNLFIH
jgi:hypothetical protein